MNVSAKVYIMSEITNIKSMFYNISTVTWGVLLWSGLNSFRAQTWQRGPGSALASVVLLGAGAAREARRPRLVGGALGPCGFNRCCSLRARSGRSSACVCLRLVAALMPLRALPSAVPSAPRCAQPQRARVVSSVRCLLRRRVRSAAAVRACV